MDAIDSREIELIPPCEGALVDLRAPVQELEEARAHADRLSSIQISDRSLCNLECLAAGLFRRWRGSWEGADYQRALEEMRLTGEALSPIPIKLPLPDGAEVEPGRENARKVIEFLTKNRFLRV